MKLTKNTRFEILGTNGQIVAVLKVKAIKKAPKVKADKLVSLTDIRGSWNSGRDEFQQYNAVVNLTERTIFIHGFTRNCITRKAVTAAGNLETVYDAERLPFEGFFKIGDVAEYDSYNLKYTAPITNITKTYVEFKPYGNRAKRLKLDQFISRNYDLNLSKIAADNFDTMQHI